MLRYRLRLAGLENAPATGGVIFTPNHVSFLDVALLYLCAPRPVRFLMWAGYENSVFLGAVSRFFGAIPVSPARAKSAFKTAEAHLNAGGCVCIFPEGQITRNGSMSAFQGGSVLLAERAGVPVVPVYLDGLWGSTFSFSGRGLFKKFPRISRPSVTVAFGKPVFPKKPAELRAAVQELGADVYAARPAFRRHIGDKVIRALASCPWKTIIVDRSGAKRVGFRAGTFLAVARMCARDWKKTIPEERVGIILPPGIGGALANVGCVLAGKSPVNLNFTLGRAQVAASIEKTGLKTFITAGLFREKLDEKFPDFPWDEMPRIIDIAEFLKKQSKLGILFNLALVWTLPGRLVSILWGIPRLGGDREAAVLCTSGSSGQPKGVPLSHANILGNCEQFGSSGLVPQHAVLLGNLPIFHSFGFTVSLWFALTQCIRTVNTPSPIEVARNVAAIREEKVSVMIGTPTFYRTYLKKATREDMASVQLVVAGAEKTSAGFFCEWEERFGGVFFEGYGATETTPVAAVNLYEMKTPKLSGGVFKGNLRGSVGRLLTGMAARFTNPLTGEPSGDNTGVLWLKGVNVFAGYLDDEIRTKDVLRDGWYCTGDIARIDEDGFLFIEGRQARFSKIGGEMVPHGTVEDAIRSVLGFRFEDVEVPRIAVAARMDEAKGESLVLLSTVEIDPERLRTGLAESGIANLWIPKTIKRVDEIPVLATGKLDLKRLSELAAE